jgi:hypothetical protein
MVTVLPDREQRDHIALLPDGGIVTAVDAVVEQLALGEYHDEPEHLGPTVCAARSSGRRSTVDHRHGAFDGSQAGYRPGDTGIEQ